MESIKESILNKIPLLNMAHIVNKTNLKRTVSSANEEEDDLSVKIKKTNDENILTLTKDFIKTFLENYTILNNIDTRWVNIDMLTEYIYTKVPEVIEKNKFYTFVAESCVEKTSYHPDYNILASRIYLDKIYMNTPNNIRDTYNILYYKCFIHLLILILFISMPTNTKK